MKARIVFDGGKARFVFGPDHAVLQKGGASGIRLRLEFTAALDRAARDRALVTSANRVAALSLTAYTEGAAGLPAVLEATRNARETLARYIDDVAATNLADAALRLFTAGSAP